MMRSTIAPTQRVNVAGAPHDVFARLVRLVRADIAVLQGLTWRRVAYTFLVAAAFAVYTATSRWLYLRYGPEPQAVGIAAYFLTPRWGWLSSFIVHSCVFCSQMLAVSVADNLRVPRIPRVAALTIALVIGTAVGAALIVFCETNRVANFQTNSARFNWIMTWALLYGAIMELIYFKRRRDGELAAALHEATLRGVELQRRTLESQLQVLQAQIEPQFLFNTLQRVGELYQHDSASADQMLDSLIVYLRAALPQMRTKSSTLGQEVQLAQAYLNIERIRRQGQLDFEFDVPERLASATFPPMVLLPLIEALSASCASNGKDDHEVLFAKAHADTETLEVTLTNRARTRVGTDACENIRARLAPLYGDRGTLVVDSAVAEGVVATLRLRYAAT